MRTISTYIILCLITLSSVFCRAEKRTVIQEFYDMFSVKKTLVVENSNQTGRTDFVTYTCSSGARFYIDTHSGNKIAIYLETSDSQQVTTTPIENLDSLCIYYAPDSKIDMTVSIKEGDGEWTEVPVVQRQKGFNTVQMPRAGDYSVRIARKGSNVYIKEIRYAYIDLSGCPNCFLYKP